MGWWSDLTTAAGDAQDDLKDWASGVWDATKTTVQQAPHVFVPAANIPINTAGYILEGDDPVDAVQRATTTAIGGAGNNIANDEYTNTDNPAATHPFRDSWLADYTVPDFVDDAKDAAEKALDWAPAVLAGALIIGGAVLAKR